MIKYKIKKIQASDLLEIFSEAVDLYVVPRDFSRRHYTYGY